MIAGVDEKKLAAARHALIWKTGLKSISRKARCCWFDYPAKVAAIFSSSR